MLLRRSAAGLVALASALAIAGCGGSGSSTVAAGPYMKSVCTAVSSFEQDVRTRSSALKTSTIAKSPAQGKVIFQDFLSAVADDSRTALTRLKAAGTPGVTDGNKIEAAFISVFSRLEDAMNHAAASASALPTTSGTAFQSGANSLIASFESTMTGLGSSLSGLKSPALDKAAAKEPACSSLSS